MRDSAREEEWAQWMRLAIAGDVRSYHKLLTALTPHLRMIARKRCEQYGAPASEAEDVVQEVLLAIHLKRGTWDWSRPLGPWMAALIRNKLVDSLRRRSRQISVPLEDVTTVFVSEERLDADHRVDVEQMLARLRDPQRTIVRLISIEGSSVRETAERMSMTDVAVRVSLHRALKALSAMYVGQTK